MKRFTFILVLVFVGAGDFQTISAQTTGPWIEVSSSDASFLILMPRQPEQAKKKQTYGETSINGTRYAATAVGATYTVWSLENANYRPASSSSVDAYLDACADLAWESLL